ncbi:MAG TPA: TerB family tellurite resistance protein [Vicinamibacterales bacterium]
MSLLKFFGLTDDQGANVDSLGEIERVLAEIEPRDARYLACFAYILHRIARADHEVTEEESSLIERLVADRGGLSAERAHLVARIARTEGLRHGGTEDFIVSREFAGVATREQKLALLDCLFAVSASDSSIRTLEDNEIRRVASEIKLDHADFIAARAAHAAHLQSRRGSK